MRTQWAPGPQLLACVAGTVMCLGGLRRGGIRGLLMFCCGGALTTRVAANSTIGQVSDTTQKQPEQSRTAARSKQTEREKETLTSVRKAA
jgi:uncharacterized membrane protein